VVHHNFLGFKGKCLNQVEIGITRQSPQNPKERLLVLIVRFSGNVEILQVAFAVEGDLSRLNFSVLLINFVSYKHDRNVITDASEVLVPLGHIFVSDSGCHIKHNNGSVSTNVISLAEPSKLLLACRVPDIQFDGSMIGIKSD